MTQYFFPQYEPEALLRAYDDFLALTSVITEYLKIHCPSIMIIIVPYEGEGERLEICRFSINTTILKNVPVMLLMVNVLYN